MMSLWKPGRQSTIDPRRVLVAAVILAVTIPVSAVWGEMVYTIPVLAVMLFLAAGLKGAEKDAPTRNTDEGGGADGTDVNH